MFMERRMSNSALTNRRRSREKILAAAESAFLRHGFLGASMDMVADGAAVSKQTVYAHFKSKEALFIEVVVSMTGSASVEIGEDVEDVSYDRSAKEYLLAVAVDQLKVVMTPRLMQLRRLVIGEVERFPELGRSLYANGPARSIVRIRRALGHFASVGQLTIADLDLAATHFNWIVMGAPLNAAMFLGNSGIPEEGQLHAHAKEAVRIFMCAYSSALGAEK
jgi:TetR/AcrR family transcriptional regulator, mexJK operon transcriptional repressor